MERKEGWRRDFEAGLDAETRLEVAVVFTSIRPTMAALGKAAALAGSLNGRITMIVPQVVPYHLPLRQAAEVREWNERRFRVLAEEVKVETQVRICLCRDRAEALRQVLAPASVVVLGGAKSWWPTREKRLAKALRAAGHEVILIPV